MLNVKHRETIAASSYWVAAGFICLHNHAGGETLGVVVERIVPHDFALESACGSICSIHDSVQKLSAVGCGYRIFVGVGMAGEGDGLVGVGFGFLSGQCGHSTPQPSWVLAVRKIVQFSPTPPTVVNSNGISQLTIYGGNFWVHDTRDIMGVFLDGQELRWWGGVWRSSPIGVECSRHCAAVSFNAGRQRWCSICWLNVQFYTWLIDSPLKRTIQRDKTNLLSTFLHLSCKIFRRLRLI